MTTDLEKLRRFALLVALVLITYTIAGVDVEASRSVTVLGVPLRIVRPDLLRVSLVFACAYSACRFAFYGFVMQVSPATARRDLLAAYTGGEGRVREGDTDKLVQRFSSVLPERWTRLDFIRSEGEESYLVRLAPISCRQRLAAWLLDLDYAAPIWLNAVALSLSLYCWRSPAC